MKNWKEAHPVHLVAQIDRMIHSRTDRRSYADRLIEIAAMLKGYDPKQCLALDKRRERAERQEQHHRKRRRQELAIAFWA